MTRDIAAAASVSAFFFMSCEPMLSVMVAALLRSATIASADEVTASMKNPGAVTVTVSAKRVIDRPTLASMTRSPAATSTFSVLVS